jgi:hypothetical protein
MGLLEIPRLVIGKQLFKSAKDILGVEEGMARLVGLTTRNMIFGSDFFAATFKLLTKIYI